VEEDERLRTNLQSVDWSLSVTEAVNQAYKGFASFGIQIVFILKDNLSSATTESAKKLIITRDQVSAHSCRVVKIPASAIPKDFAALSRKVIVMYHSFNHPQARKHT